MLRRAIAAALLTKIRGVYVLGCATGSTRTIVARGTDNADPDPGGTPWTESSGEPGDWELLRAPARLHTVAGR
ncbi:hypothetical protein GCM10010302_57580 [Streptomyces polychromogenes]|uniref:Uncharacterized protein n=1 Tax=Streptomyces polychromogenes TaxID=67342 RepID=A0ABP3FDQ8_9ACTN